MALKDEALALHKKYRGKIATAVKVPLRTKEDLTLAYTPGVAEVSKEIARHREKVYELTSKWNTIAIVTDGTRILGLGNIGPEAAMPVMEGKAALFKEFGGVDAVPICLRTRDPDKIVDIVKCISPGFGGINIEDIDSPKVLDIKARLIRELDIPIFHDDGDGTAIVVLAGLTNALKVVGKDIGDVSCAIAGAGSAGYAISKLLHSVGMRKIIITDSKGIIRRGRKEGMNKYKEELAGFTNAGGLSGGLEQAIAGADIFIGTSAVPNLVSKEMVKGMADDAIVFALSNPDPEILPGDALEAGAKIVATGSSQYPNQANNLLVFPGVFRGLLDARARLVTEEIKLAAAGAIAGLVPKSKLKPDFVLPNAIDKSIGVEVAKAVVKASKK